MTYEEMTHQENLNRQVSKEDIFMAHRHMEMLNVGNQQGAAKQNHNEISLHTSQNG